MRHISQTHSGHVEGLNPEIGSAFIVFFLLIHHHCEVITIFQDTPHIKITLPQKW
jgi:hypothetical protein